MEFEAKHISDDYPTTNVTKIILKTQPPFTERQRTLLQRDILAHAVEGEITGGEETSDEEWADFQQEVIEASDVELNKKWEACAEWILSRQDVPLVDNSPVAQAIKKELHSADSYFSPDDLWLEHPTLIHQRYKRFSETLNPDYGFLMSAYNSVKHIGDLETE